MAWTRTWPKAADDEIYLEDLNELNSELNLRAGLSNAAFAEGDALWNCIWTMRSRVNGVLHTVELPAHTGKFLDGDGFFWGYPGEDTQYTGYSRQINPWKHLYGGSRLAWRNKADGTEATAGDQWEPEACGLEDSEPYEFLLNELYDVINLLEWNIIPVAATHGSLNRHGDPSWETSAQDALDAAWASFGAATATSAGTPLAHTYAAWQTQTVESGTEYSLYMDEWRQFFSHAIPTHTAARLVLYQLDQNRFDTDPDGDDDTPPAWNVLIRAGTDAIPSPPTDDEWTYGAQIGTVAVPDELAASGSEYEGAWYGALTGLEAGETNYIQIIGDGLAAKPQYLVDDGWWDDAGAVMRQEHSALYQYRLAVKRF